MEFLIEALPKNRYQLAAFLFVTVGQLAVEYWLGKTERTKSSSILEAILAGLAMMVAIIATVFFLLIRRDKNGKGSVSDKSSDQTGS